MGHQSHEGHRISIAETQPGQGLTKPGQGLTQPGQAFSLKLYPRQDLPLRRPQDGELNEAPLEALFIGEGNGGGFGLVFMLPSSVVE